MKKTCQSKNTSNPSPLLVDIRPVVARGESPCHTVESALEKLQNGQIFILQAPFEPRPLFARLERMGYQLHSSDLKDGDWRFEFHPTGEKSTEPHSHCKCSSAAASSTPTTTPRKNATGDLLLDTRGMEPPQPLTRVLETIQVLKPGRRISMLGDRRPVHLFDHLERKGFSYSCDEQPDHSFLTTIWHSS